MAHVLDGMVVLPPVVMKEKCPICEKAPHPDRTTTDKKENKGCLKSIPANLGCVPLVPIPGLPRYTTAAHHLIPANQCLKQFPRLGQMAKTVGYNVNNAQNGISLPTCSQGDLNQYEAANGLSAKYGDLAGSDKERVAFRIMEGTTRQWHVGHHNWTIPLDTDTDHFAHVENYDKLVKRQLRDLELKIKENGEEICEPKDKKKESGSQVIQRLNALSAKIRAGVLGWAQYYVSALACKFASGR